MSKLKDINIIEKTLSIKSSLKTAQLPEIEAIAGALAAAVKGDGKKNEGEETKHMSDQNASANKGGVDPAAMFKLSYGLFVLSARDGDKDNGCIINTVTQITVTPLRMTIAVNKANYTHDMVLKTGVFNISILSESAPFSVFERFGFKSGRDTDKFDGFGDAVRSANGVRYIPKYTSGMISGKVVESYDYGTHTLFVADVTEAAVLSDVPSVTYQYYFDNIKPKPPRPGQGKKGYVCKICGYVYEGEPLPDDFICPLCKHGAADFEPLK
jgi:flavin reductase (DIM6/NTAB) family NADH-FMN oxidoreductase RutF